MRVKICGITNMPDALEAIRAGVDAMGFNLFPGSRRYVPVEEITWVGNLAGTAVRVAVMVNPSIEEIRRARPFFDVIQLHGQETAEMCAEAASTGPVWKAFPLAEDMNAKAIAAYQADALIIDSMTAGAFGGTGVADRPGGGGEIRPGVCQAACLAVRRIERGKCRASGGNGAPLRGGCGERRGGGRGIRVARIGRR